MVILRGRKKNKTVQYFFGGGGGSKPVSCKTIPLLQRNYVVNDRLMGYGFRRQPCKQNSFHLLVQCTTFVFDWNNNDFLPCINVLITDKITVFFGLMMTAANEAVDGPNKWREHSLSMNPVDFKKQKP